MTLFESLLDKYGYNEPIIPSEISYCGYSMPWIYKELNRLCGTGELIRYEKGVYYIPSTTPLGKSILNPRKVIEKKYISSNDNIFGYYSGATLLNQLGLSTQMPNVIEIFTNNESAIVREIYIGKQRVLLRKKRTTINKDNVSILSFLELMNTTRPTFFNAERCEKLKQYIKENGINKNDITKYASYFPDKVFRTLVESGVIYNVTS